MSIVLASSNFIGAIFKVINFTGNKLNEMAKKSQTTMKSSSIASNFSTVMNERYIIDRILSKGKKFKLYKILMASLFLFLLTFLVMVIYYYSWIDPIYFRNLTEFKLVQELTHLEIMVGFSFLGIIEMVTYSYQVDKSNYQNIMDF